MNTENESSNKRKNILDPEHNITEPELKRPKCEALINILDFSDCVFINILKYLDTTSLYQLGRTCTRFERLVTDPKFWKHVYARKPPNDISKAEFITNNVGSYTKHILLAGDKRSDQIIPLSIFTQENFLTNITVLALENQFLDGKTVRLKDFPKTLEELSFRRSFILEYRNFFNASSTAMSRLRVLILDHCQWLETDLIFCVSKYPNLEIFSLYMCKKVNDHNVAHFCIMSRFGFKKLQVLDVRFTGLGNECINSFYCSSTLQELYLQSYCTTYREERAIRKASLLEKDEKHGEGVSYVSDDDDNDDSCLSNIKKRFGGSNLNTCRIDTVSDASMQFYSRTRSLKRKDGSSERPRSVLYKYPYSEECTCGFYEEYWSNIGQSTPEPSSSSSTIDPPRPVSPATSEKSPDDRSLDSIYFFHIDPIAYYRFRKNVQRHEPLPDYLHVESNQLTKDRRWIGLRDPLNDYEISMLEHTDYRLDSYAIATQFLDFNTIDFTDPIAVMYSLNRDFARRQVHVIRRAEGFDAFDFANPAKTLFGDIEPTDEVLSFTTELLVNSARLIYLLFDELRPIKPSPIISLALFSIYHDGDKLQQAVRQASKKVSCVTRKVLRTFVIGYALLRTYDPRFRNTICNLVQRVYNKVSLDCQKMFLPVLREKADALRANVPYEHGIYVNEPPEDYNDEEWGFCLANGEVMYKEDRSICGQDGCGDCPETEPVEIRDGREDAVKADFSGWEIFFNRMASAKAQWDGKDPSKPDLPRSPKLSPKLAYKRLNPLYRHHNRTGDLGLCIVGRRVGESSRDNNEQDHNDEGEPGPPLGLLRLIEISLRRNDENDQEQQQNPVRLRHENIEIVRNFPVREIPLRRLSLRGFPNITNRSLIHIDELELDLLDVTKTKVTAEAVKSYLLLHPSCRVVHESACTCGPKLHF
ncbi:uncharacterized protein LOC108736746 isoform X2 [Agrilus planipennis]|uniref:Uncharacterized protein LOC108736746 isoform X2 n=1 Tax=Agrilus planipennis TaxID=224129 RepID=A0A1W4WLJ2_AGRPL|nr:uncharacterized protein LOC108736746 isoform X2 [Agrilus planipennis]